MTQQIRVGADAVVHGDDSGRATEITPELAYRRLAIVNVAFAGARGAHEWVLIDAGVAGTAPMIRAAAEDRFGSAARPSAIILTHGHFDHVGALEALAAH